MRLLFVFVVLTLNTSGARLEKTSMAPLSIWDPSYPEFRHKVLIPRCIECKRKGRRFCHLFDSIPSLFLAYRIGNAMCAGENETCEDIKVKTSDHAEDLDHCWAAGDFYGNRAACQICTQRGRFWCALPDGSGICYNNPVPCYAVQHRNVGIIASDCWGESDMFGKDRDIEKLAGNATIPKGFNW